jgi:hypothetical protein
VLPAKLWTRSALAKSFNIRQHPPTSANIRQHPPTSANIRQHPPTSANIRQLTGLAYIRGSRVKKPFQLHSRSVLCLVKNYGIKRYEYIHKLDRLIP